MAHLSDGALLEYLDGMQDSARGESVRAHLEDCDRCRARAEDLHQRAGRVSAALSALAPAAPDSPHRQRALAQLQDTVSTRQESPMFNRLWSNRNARRLAIGLATLLVITGLFALEPVRAMASDFLGLFRVEQFTTVSVDPARMQQIADALNQNMYMGEQQMLKDRGQPTPVASLDEAAAQAGFTPATPQGFGTPDEIMVTDSWAERYTPDVASLRAVFQAVGVDPSLLPDNIDGQPFDVSVPAGVMLSYSDGDPDLHNDFTIFQIPSPTVNVPAGVDVQALGDAMLQLLGMTPQQAAQLSQHIDWATTLVVPIPTGTTDVTEVNINGTSGLLFKASGTTGDNGSGTPESAILWQNNGIVSMVVGSNNGSRLIAIAESMEDN
jgi:hypothetical protein